ncbi:MAG: hypothetical protein IJT43_09090 [Stomatobaculum sp.]|nr:hypothetical protein [Stomatobaculum sp.]
MERKLISAVFAVLFAVSAAVTVFAETGAGSGTQEEKGPGIITEAAAETEAPAPQVTEEQVNTFYQDAVFVGDSIMEDFQLYCRQRKTDPFLQQFRFLARTSFSLHNAFMPISKKSKMPIYQGEQRYIWDSVRMVGAKTVYMMFGQNDLDMGNDSVEKYCAVISKIKEQSPDAQFVIMSMTYTLAGKGKGPINNDNIRAFNEAMKNTAAQNGWGFIDLSTPTSDGNGNLRPEYCSDHYVHHTNAAYRVWETVLKEYAYNCLTRMQAEGGGV